MEIELIKSAYNGKYYYNAGITYIEYKKLEKESQELFKQAFIFDHAAKHIPGKKSWLGSLENNNIERVAEAMNLELPEAEIEKAINRDIQVEYENEQSKNITMRKVYLEADDGKPKVEGIRIYPSYFAYKQLLKHVGVESLGEIDCYYSSNKYWFVSIENENYHFIRECVKKVAAGIEPKENIYYNIEEKRKELGIPGKEELNKALNCILS